MIKKNKKIKVITEIYRQCVTKRYVYMNIINQAIVFPRNENNYSAISCNQKSPEVDFFAHTEIII